MHNGDGVVVQIVDGLESEIQGLSEDGETGTQ